MKPLLLIAIALLIISINQHAFSQTGDDYANLGIQELKSGYNKLAVYDLTKALPFYQDAPHLSNLYEYIGTANYNLGNYDDAIVAFNKCLGYYPEDTDVFKNVLECYIQQNDYAGIIKECELGLTRYKQHHSGLTAYLYYTLGDALPYMGKINKSIEAFNNVIALDSTTPSPYWERGNAYADTGNFAHAITDYKKAISLATSNTHYLYKIYNAKAIYERWSGQYQHALDDEQTALKLNPQCAELYLGIGRCYMLLNNVPQAEQAFHNVILYDSTRNLIPLAYCFSGDTMRAIAMIKKSIADDANSNNLMVDYLYGAYIMTYTNNPGGAIAYLKEGFTAGLTKADVMYDDDLVPLRKNPDFIALLKK